ncbi:MAG TPA: hydrolase [Armatimonadota bacterium]|nr:hydrolase [Armatimonadota bacterium]
MLIDRDDAVLVIVDVQERLFPHIDRGDAVAANIVRLLQFADIVDLPVILTEQTKLGPTISPILAELPEAEPIGKLDFSCFGSEEFRGAVRELRRRTLILVGIEAHICVAQTAMGALPDYRVQIVDDAVASRSPADRAIGVERMRQAGCTITSTEMLMYEILQRAGTDEFRAVLKLVKEQT